MTFSGIDLYFIIEDTFNTVNTGNTINTFNSASCIIDGVVICMAGRFRFVNDQE